MLDGYAGERVGNNAVAHLPLGQRNAEINAPRFFGSSRICFASLKNLNVSPSAYGRGGNVGRDRGVGVVLGVCDAIGVAVGVGLAPPAKLNSPMRVFQPEL